MDRPFGETVGLKTRNQRPECMRPMEPEGHCTEGNGCRTVTARGICCPREARHHHAGRPHKGTDTKPHKLCLGVEDGVEVQMD